MLGKNAVSGPFNESGQSLRVNEIWYTLQGEGPDSGRPAIFLRLSRCNLRCYFCDTEFDIGVDIDLDRVVDQVLHLSILHGCSLVVITGGEPLLQNIVPFVRRINDCGISCSVETAGTVMLPELHTVFDPARSISGNLIVCSPKTPRIHPEMERLVGAWKYVVRAGEGDHCGLPTKSTQIPGQDSVVFEPIHAVVEIFVSPMDEQQADSNERNVKWARDVCLKYGHRLSLQIHKLVKLP